MYLFARIQIPLNIESGSVAFSMAFLLFAFLVIFTFLSIAIVPYVSAVSSLLNFLENLTTWKMTTAYPAKSEAPIYPTEA